MVTIPVLSDDEIDKTLSYVIKTDWNQFYPFDLIIHNILPAPLPFSTRTEFMQQVLHTWNQRIIAEMDTVQSTLTLKEKLFETMMLRFELFNRHKEQLHIIWQKHLSLMIDPEVSSLWLHSFNELMNYCLPQEKFITRFIRSKLFLYRYFLVQEVWFNDNTSDLQQTMAVLDQQVIKHMETFY